MPKTEVNNLFQIQLRFWMKNENSLLWLKSLYEKKPLNIASAKNFFSSIYVFATTCFDESF